MLILERPASTIRMGLMARKDGKYKRPIVGDIIDFRTEDFIHDVDVKSVVGNFVGKLPDIPEIGQVKHYVICEFNIVQTGTATIDHAYELVNAGNFKMLEGEWWQWAAVFDRYGQFIKAPKRSRENEPTAEEIDERLDDFKENQNTIVVTSPTILIKRSAPLQTAAGH